jgi:phosphonate transport system substrate-binding protein
LPLFEAGDVDFAWLPPIAFLLLRKKGLVRTLYVNERNASHAFHAIVAVRSGSRHYSLDRLRGARAAWIDPMSTTGYVLPKLDLAARNVDPRTTFSEERFLGSHDAAARAVLEGRSDVFGTFAEYDGQRIARAGFSGVGSASDWRVVLRGRESPSDVLAAHTSVDMGVASAVKRALARALGEPETAKLVRDVLHVDAFGDADDARYASLSDAVDAARRDGLLPHL